MRLAIRFVFIGKAFILFTSASLAVVINVPADYPTIQQGIDATSNGDTVLVHPGTYVENVNFNGHSIVLGSLFLTTEDTSYIAATIIDGDSSGSVITIESGEDNATMVIGLSITNGTSPNGGGIFCANGSSPTISRNIIFANFAFSRLIGNGGGVCCVNSDPIITSNFIFNNVAYGDPGMGGGIYFLNSSATITRNLISGNRAMGYGYGVGGGIRCHGSDGIIENNIIIGNDCQGGFGGGLDIYTESVPQVSNNYFEDNTAAIGGGISLLAGFCDLANNIVVNNTASYEGGGIFSTSAEFSISNCTIAGNLTANQAGALYLDYGSSAAVINSIFWNYQSGEIFLGSDCTIQVSYSDIHGGWQGEGNIDCDPMFCSPDYDDYHLHTSSCCVGAGETGADIGALDVGCGLVPCDSYVVGDFNGSGEFNVADIVSSYSRLATGSPNPALQCECPPGSGQMLAAAMDVNNTCVFNVADVVVAYQRLSYGQPELQPCQYCPPETR